MNVPFLPSDRPARLPRFLRPLFVVPLILLTLLLTTPFLIRHYYRSRVPYIELPFNETRERLLRDKPEVDGLALLRQAADKIPNSFRTYLWEPPDSNNYHDIDPQAWLLVDEHRDTLSMIQQAADNPWFMSDDIRPLRPFETAIGKTEWTTHIAALIVCRIGQALHQNDPEGALDAYRLLLRLAYKTKLFREEADVVADYLLKETAFQSLLFLCNSPRVTSDFLERLQQELEDLAHQHSFHLADTLLLHHFSSALILTNDEIPESFPFTAFFKNLRSGKLGPSERSWLSAERDVCERFDRQLIANMVDYVDLPLWEQPPFFDTDAITLPYRLTKSQQKPHAMPSDTLRQIEDNHPTCQRLRANYEGLLQLSLMYRSYLAAMPTLVAIHRFRRDHGEIPNTLDELTPAFIKQLPLDPCDRSQKPLRYRRVDQDFTIWCIGTNLVDDGGDDSRDLRTSSLLHASTPIVPRIDPPHGR